MMVHYFKPNGDDNYKNSNLYCDSCYGQHCACRTVDQSDGIYCTRGNFRQEKIFANFTICSHWRNFYHAIFLSCVHDNTEDMATFTALAKIYSTKYFCSTKVSGVGVLFVKQKFSRIRYNTHSPVARDLWQCKLTLSSGCALGLSRRTAIYLRQLSYTVLLSKTVHFFRTLNAHLFWPTKNKNSDFSCSGSVQSSKERLLHNRRHDAAWRPSDITCTIAMQIDKNSAFGRFGEHKASLSK